MGEPQEGGGEGGKPDMGEPQEGVGGGGGGQT